MKGCHDAEGRWDPMKSDHSGILKTRHGHCVCAVNPSICANDVSDSRMTRTSDGAPVLRPQWGVYVEIAWLQSAVSPPSYAVSRTEAVRMKCARTRLTLLPSAGLCSRRLSRLQGWDRRLRWSFRLVISSFQKRDSRREDWPTQIRPPVHPRPGEWTPPPSRVTVRHRVEC